MTNNTIAKLLDNAGIAYTIIDGAIWADDVYTHLGEVFTNQTNVTGWTGRQLAEWLGY